MIVKPAPGKQLKDIQRFIDAKKAGKDECLAVAKEAADVAIAEAITVQESSGLDHSDLNADNVFFNDAVSSYCVVDHYRLSDHVRFPAGHVGHFD